MVKLWIKPLLVSVIVALASLYFYASTRWDGIQKMRELTSEVSQSDLAVIVVFNFPPETFHMSIFANMGGLQKVEGNQVYLADGTYSAMQELSNYFWIQSIHLWKKDGVS